MTRTELQTEYHKEKGAEAVDAQGSFTHEYVEWLQDRIIGCDTMVTYRYVSAEERMDELMENKVIFCDRNTDACEHFHSDGKLALVTHQGPAGNFHSCTICGMKLKCMTITT